MASEQPPYAAPISLTQGIIQKAILEQSDGHDFWFDLGFQVFGPLFLGKFLWFIKGLKAHPPEKVLFFARDAHIHHRLYLRYASGMGISAPCEYAYFSRASLLVPSLTEFRIDRSWFLYSGKAGRSVGEHLKRLGVDHTQIGAELNQAGYRSLEEPVINGCPKMFGLLQSIYPHLLRAASRNRNDVARYIRQLVGESRRIAMLDIGWVGNMQSSFSRLLQLDRNDFEVRGYYYGTFQQITSNYMPRNFFSTYLVNECKPNDWYEALLSGGVELLEFAQMAPHGTTLGYRDVDGVIEPVLEDSKADQNMQGLSFRIQEGAEAFIERIMPSVLALGVEHLVSTDWALPFFRLVMSPNLEEAEYVGEITHSDAPASTSVRLKLAPKLEDKAGRYNKNEYLDALDESYWKAAFKLRNPTPRSWGMH